MNTATEQDLEHLAKQIRECTRCELRQSATMPVPGFGNLGTKYFLIGEAPGASEDRENVPFIGLAGRRLNELLALASIDPNDCYFTNVCKCRPPQNKTPRKAFINACRPWLMEEIRLVKPKQIITLGATPLSLFTASGGVSQYHGTQFTVDLPIEE